MKNLRMICWTGLVFPAVFVISLAPPGAHGSLCSADVGKIFDPGRRNDCNGDQLSPAPDHVDNNFRGDVAVLVREPEVDAAIENLRAPSARERTCQQLAEQIYARILERMHERSRLSGDQIEEEMRKLPLVKDGTTLFGIRPLTEQSNPVFLAWLTCPLGATEGYSTFRIYEFSNGHYHVAARSEDFPVLQSADRSGQRLDQGLLEVKFMPQSPSSQGCFLTHWTVGGSSPPIFSIILWRWDGQKLNPIWLRTDLRNHSFRMLGSIIWFSVPMGSFDVAEGEKPAWRHEVYRVEKGRVLLDGLLDQALADRYLRQGLINPKDAENLTEWAYIYSLLGNPTTAVRLLEQAVSSNPGYIRPYFTLSRLYEEQADYVRAAMWMHRLADVAGGLSPEGRRRLDDLERKSGRKP